jgi:hypothetical protein
MQCSGNVRDPKYAFILMLAKLYFSLLRKYSFSVFDDMKYKCSTATEGNSEYALEY